jgi:hypothetical protein
MGHPIRTRRLLAALIVSFALVPLAPAPGGAQPARGSGGSLEQLRERARFRSSSTPLHDLGGPLPARVTRSWLPGTTPAPTAPSRAASGSGRRSPTAAPSGGGQ